MFPKPREPTASKTAEEWSYFPLSHEDGHGCSLRATGTLIFIRLSLARSSGRHIPFSPAKNAAQPEESRATLASLFPVEQAVWQKRPAEQMRRRPGKKRSTSRMKTRWAYTTVHAVLASRQTAKSSWSCLKASAFCIVSKAERFFSPLKKFHRNYGGSRK